MLRIIVVLGFFGLIYQTCRGDSTTEDWRRQGFYRPRRNFPSQSQNDNYFQSSHNQSTFKTNAQSTARSSFGQSSESLFGINNYQNSPKQSSFGFSNQPQYNSGTSQTEKGSDSSSAFSQNQRPFGASYPSLQKQGSNTEVPQSRNGFRQNTIGSRGAQNSLGASLSQNLQGPDYGQNSFRSGFSQFGSQPAFGSYNQNSKQNSFESFGQNSQIFGNFGQKVQQNPFGRFQNENAFSSFGNIGFAKGQNYHAPDYLPPKPFKAPEYLPPDPRTTSTTTRRPFYTTTTSKRPFFTTTTTRRPFQTTTTTRKPLYTTTTRRFYTTTTTKRPFFTSTTTKKPFFTTTTTRRPIYTTSTSRSTMTYRPLPAMAMAVPLPDDDDEDETFPDTITKKPGGAVAPAMAMEVPPEPDDDGGEIVPDFRTTTEEIVTAAMAMLVPPEEEDPITTVSTTTSSTTISTPSTTISTTPSTTTSTTPSTTTSTTPSTTTSTTPPTTTSITPSPTTTSTIPPTTTSTTPSTTTSTTPTTIVTTPSTTTITLTTADLNRHLIEEESIPTEATSTTTVLVTKASTTTIKPPYIGPAYLPPDTKVTYTTTSTTTVNPKVAPPVPAAGAEKVPEEPKCDPLDPSTWPTEYEQRNFGELPCAPVTTTTTTSAPVPPAPALAIPVPPEPECNPLDPSTWPSEIDQREFGVTPCVPITSTSSTTTTTTASTTPSTTISTTPSTTTTLTTPSSTTSTTPSTTTSTTPTTTSTTPSTTTSTTPSTTTTSTTPSTTTSTTPSTTTSTTPSTTTTSTTPSTTPSTTTASTVKPYIGLEYLPPSNETRNAPPSPAIAEIVPPEPECDPLDPSTWPSEVDQRDFGEKSCAPNITKPPYVGLSYLPPDEECVPKTRRRRSSNETLRLGDVKGTPRPVWYAGIYRKTTDPYFPICGGSIVREDIVISAAHCFWNDVVGLQPAQLFAVAASKIYKPWKDPMDKKAQKSDVLDIKIPARFLGAKTSFQEDIAILKLATPFKYTRGVRPICVDFDDDFDRQQMTAGHHGTIAGWGLTDSKGTPTQRLLWLELPYIEIEKCIRDSEDAFLKYITCDKVCAGENDTGKALCKGDSGGGMAFWSGPAEHATPYLRGVASTAPSPRNAECNVYAYGSFTHVRAHRTFLRDHVPDIERCRFWE